MRGLVNWLLLFIVFFVFVPCLPGVAWAQEGAAPPIDVSGLLSSSTMIQVAFWIGVALTLVEVAKRICARIPGERDDQIVNWIYYVLRWIMDLIAGKTGKPSDPSLIKRE